MHSLMLKKLRHSFKNYSTLYILSLSFPNYLTLNLGFGKTRKFYF